MEIRKVQREDARAAALLHIEGQPGTFLTTLGEGFLTAFYAGLSDSKWGYGYVAMEGDDALGVAIGTNDTHALFRELMTREGAHLALPTLCRLIRHPSLLAKVLQTFFYPDKLDIEPGEAELLFIGVRDQSRRRRIGTQLLDALSEESRRRGAIAFKVTVDAANSAANAFYVNYGFQIVGGFELYGRKMNLYYLPLAQAQMKPGGSSAPLSLTESEV